MRRGDNVLFDGMCWPLPVGDYEWDMRSPKWFTTRPSSGPR